MSNCILVNIIVYGKTMQRAIRILDNMVKGMDTEQILLIRRGTYDYQVLMKSGVWYKALKCGDGARGYRFQQAIVDCQIDAQDIQLHIEPYACYSELPEEEQIIISEFSKVMDIKGF